MIDKRFPRKLNQSVDSRLRGKDEMIDALDIDVSERFSDSNNSDGVTGSGGVVKPKRGQVLVQGNEQSDQAVQDTSFQKAIGSCTDTRMDVALYAVWSSSASDMGVYAYDPYGNLPGSLGPENMRKVWTSSLFNFPQNGFADMEVVYTNERFVIDGFELDFTPYLLLTDNVNEPKKINILRALTEDLSDYNDLDEVDFITACPKTPMIAPTFEFVSDPSRTRSNYEGVSGLQFAYQCLYKGGVETALSTYSDLAVPPSYVNQGTLLTPALIQHNKCVITVPTSSLSSEVDKVRLVAREGNTGSFFMVDEYEVDNTQDLIIDYYNDRLTTIIPEEDEDKRYDNLPHKAETLAVTQNRLFYGNYVQDRDVPDVDVDITVDYEPRPNDFTEYTLSVTPHIFQVDKNNELDALLNNIPDGVSNRVAGFWIDTFQLPFNIPQGTVINLEFVVAPERNWHLYNTDVNSYHGSRYVFPSTGDYVTDLNDGTLAPLDETLTSIYTDSNVLVGQSQVSPMFGQNAGVAVTLPSQSRPKWVTTSGEFAGQETDVAFGTSAGNPLILKGSSVSFSFSIRLQDDTTVPQLKNIVTEVLTGSTEVEGVDVISSNVSPNVSFDLNLRGAGETVIDVNSTTNSIASLITACADSQVVEGGLQYLPAFVTPGGSVLSAAPVGCFIVDKAEVDFGLRVVNPYSDDEAYENDIFVGIDIKSISGVETVTAIPETAASSGKISKWKVYSKDYLLDVPSAGRFVDEDLTIPNLAISDEDSQEDRFLPTYLSRRLMAGYLDLNGSRLYSTRGDTIEGLIQEGVVVDDNIASLLGTSIVDGQGGPYALRSVSNQGTSIIEGSVSSLMLMQGSIGGSMLEAIDVSLWTVMSQIQGDTDVQIFSPPSYYTAQNTSDLPEVEVLSVESFGFNEGEVTQSFKTNATHPFVIAYYDQRGRLGAMAELGDVFVAGYSNLERDGELHGNVRISFQFNHNPPEWAFTYKVLYSGNSTVKDFIQYTTGGAFTPTSNEEDENLIYVSLNYLQGSSSVSYSKAFGSVNEDGDKDFYTFTEGDKLRIISYYDNDTDRVFPYNYDFNVVGTANLTDDPDSNPLVDSELESSVIEAKQGQFVILKSNPNASGFTYTEVRGANINPSTSLHKWNNRCVVELYKPAKAQETEDRFFYEVTDSYRVVRELNDEGDLVLTHEDNPVELTKGDVWWRRVAVNIPTYENALFKNIIEDEESNPKFRPYYLESNTFSDQFPGNNSWNRGKGYFLRRTGETRRLSSYTFSDLNNYESNLFRFTSFNASKSNYKDAPDRYGVINKLVDNGESLITIQQDKFIAWPINRNMITDAAGVDQLIVSSDIIGTPRIYTGDYGCDGNPESVVRCGKNIYFANKTMAEVYRFNPTNGLAVISESGMKDFFYRLFTTAMANSDIRVVGGYDPLKDEYLITVIPTNIIDYIQGNEPTFIRQDAVSDINPGG
ncbi:MAG: hypothetical protein HRT61_00420 [Ekhidna sp.]|nr:hypothetical protein [Ekhidna sp.]